MKISVALMIPARWGSTRFIGKPLCLILGKPLIQHVWERCMQVSGLDKLLILVDDERVARVCRKFEAEVVMTSVECQTGTDRIATVAKNMKDITHIINVQGDEAVIDTQLIQELLSRMKSNPDFPLWTVATHFEKMEDITNQNNVKLVKNISGRALYFSRSPIPFIRDSNPSNALKIYWKHLGIYGYTRDTLLQFIQLPHLELELSEKLEQLRALEYGIPIHVMETVYHGMSVDTPEDRDEVEKYLIKQQKNESP